MSKLGYNIVGHGKSQYSLIKFGAKRATRIFNNGLELQQHIGWLVLNRDCLIIFHNWKGEVVRTMNSRHCNG